MSKEDQNQSKPTGIAEIVGTVATTATAGTAGLIGHHSFTIKPALQKAWTGVVEAEVAAEAILSAELAKRPSIVPSEIGPKKWLWQQVAADPAVKQMRDAYSSLPSPNTFREVFSSMSTTKQVGLGVVAVGAGLAAGYLINAWRNSETENASRSEQSESHKSAYRQLHQDLSRTEHPSRGR